MKLLRIHCFQHVDYEDLGCIKEWCIKKGHNITYTKFYRGEPLPHVEDYDCLIVLGGPMSVYEYEKNNWLTNEKKVIKEAIDHNKTIIGICLGSQLIAEVLGARIYKNREKEIGWYDVILTEQGKNEPLFNGIYEISKVFHWHGDTFDLPKNAKHIYYSEACLNQAFLYKDNVLGLQFHFEVTDHNIISMIANGKQELTIARYIQSEIEILSFLDYIEPNNKTMFQLLSNFIK